MLRNGKSTISGYSYYVCHIINFILGYYFLIDMIAGFFHLNNVEISLSVPFKMVLFALMLSIICRNIRRIEITLCFIIVSFVCLIHILDVSSNQNTAINNLFKLFYCPVMYIYFDNFMKNQYDKWEYKIELRNEVFFYINLILGLLGFGYNTYEASGVGIKGFFYAGNELGIVVFCLFVFNFMKMNKELSMVVFFSIISFLLGTKTPLFAIWIFYLLISAIGKNKKKVFGILGIIIVAIFIYMNRGTFMNMDTIQYHLNNIEWHQNQNDTLINSLLSGRIDYLKNLIVNQKTKFNAMNLFFGYGTPTKSSEMDPFDVLYTYGIIILLFQIVFYASVAWKNRNDSRLLCFNIVYFLLAIFSGHVWFNTTSILIFCIINSLSFNEYKSKLVIHFGDRVLNHRRVHSPMRAS